MSRRPWLMIATDHKHRIAFVRGLDAYTVCLDLSGDVLPIRSSLGVVVSLHVAYDIEALARHRGRFVLIQEKQDKGAAA